MDIIPSNVNKLPDTSKQIDNLDNLTEKNWLFIKHLFANNTVVDAYALAGYESKEPSAPYVLHNRLKKSIEKIVESDGVDRIRLLREAKKLLDLPIDPEKVQVSFTEKLRSLRLLRDLVPEPAEAAKVNITSFTINRYDSKQAKDEAMTVEGTVEAAVTEAVNANVVGESNIPPTDTPPTTINSQSGQWTSTPTVNVDPLQD